ncbi:MAG: N-acetylmuramoyl-L-alanine amidase [Puniceicoccales bacterium]|nr:N-acetylmuramoyl-L-alanine amidase [Puniceicoccales bacterium]
MFCPEVFGKVSEKVSFESVFGLAKFESLARILNSSKLVKNISGSDPIVPAGKSISTDPFVMVAGIRYLTLNDIVKSLKCSVLSDNGKGFAKITKGGATVQLTAGQDCILYQTSKIYLLHRLKLNLKDILVSYDDYLKVLVPLLAINLIPGKAPALKTIVLDPGHGGKDPGAINAYLNLSEKTLALQIATSLKAELIKRGYVVTLTRETDTFVELVNRPAKAKDADLFMSLHLNSATNTSAQGVEIFTLKRAKNFSGNTFDSWNLIAAYSVLSAFGKTTSFTNRGIKMAEFAVLKSLACPGILVELGFISNDVEAKKLLDINFQKKIIQGLADGVVKYGENLKKKR